MRCMFALLVAALGAVSSMALSISTPEDLTQCAPATFTWTPSVPPYYLSIVESTDSGLYDPAQMAFSTHDMLLVIPSGTKATWVVDIPAGMNVTITLRDARGEVAQTYPRVIAEGSDECLD